MPLFNARFDNAHDTHADKCTLKNDMLICTSVVVCKVTMTKFCMLDEVSRNELRSCNFLYMSSPCAVDPVDVVKVVIMNGSIGDSSQLPQCTVRGDLSCIDDPACHRQRC